MKEKKLITIIITIIILVFLIGIIGTLLISFGPINKLQAEVNYYKQQADSCFWKQYAEKADAYIDAIYDCDCDCIYDVAMETDAYDEYVEYYGKIHSRETK